MRANLPYRVLRMAVIALLLAPLLVPALMPSPAGAAGAAAFDVRLQLSTGVSSGHTYGATGDIDGDGDVDLVVQSGLTTHLFRQRADGGLGPQELLDPQSFGTDLRIVDVDGDGRKDLVMFNTNGVAVRRGLPGGTLAPTTNLAVTKARGLGLVGDYTGDGRVDLLSLTVPNGGSTGVALLAQQPDGTFGAPTTLTTYLFRSLDMALTDVDADGRLDLVAANGSAAIVRRQLAGGTLGPNQTVTSSVGVTLVEHADFDGDGIGDLAMMGTTGVVVRPGAGGGTWGPEEVLAASAGATPVALHTPDVDGDGDRDLLSIGGDLTGLHLQVPGGLVAGDPVGPISDGGAPFPPTAIGDVNGDGDDDLVVGRETTGRIDVYYSAEDNRGPVATPPAPAVAYEDTPTPIAVTATDPDGDALSLTVVTPPEHGAVGVAGLTATYQASPGYLGPDSVVLGVSDGHRRVADVTVPITVVAFAGLEGTVTDGFRGVPGIEVIVYAGATVVDQAVTDADGRYDLHQLRAGTVTVWFHDPGDTFVSEWFNDKTTQEWANGIGLTAGEVDVVDAQLVRTANTGPITVTTTQDGVDGSLRQAIGWANANPGGDTVLLAPGATYALSCAAGGHLVSTAGALTIDGDGATIVQTCPGHRVLTHTPTTPLTLSSVTLTGGSPTDDGGAVLTAGDLTLVSAELVGNTAGGRGGGAHVGDAFTMVASALADNTATGSGGGARVVFADVDATSEVRSNEASAGGGLEVLVALELDGTLADNHATGHGGGAIADRATTGLSATVSGNVAGGHGGGLQTRYGTLSGTWSSNQATGDGGAASATSPTLPLGVYRATMTGNVAGGAGGAVSAIGVDVVASTLHANGAGTRGGAAAMSAGGGLTLRDATVTDNTAPVGAALGWAGAGWASIGTSALAGPPGSTLCALAGTTPTSAGGSWADDASCQLTGTHDTVGTDPLLGPLEDNGGPTATRRPLDASPLIDLGMGLPCASTVDQRGEPRPMGPACDAGAVELPGGGIRWHGGIVVEGDDDVRDVVALSDGSVVVVGVIAAPEDIELPPDAIWAGGTEGYVARWSANGDVEWFIVLAGTGDDTLDGIALGPTGDLVVVGSVAQSATWKLGGVAGPAPVNGPTDAVVARITAEGDVVWVRTAGGSGVDAARAVDVDAAGNIAVGGTFTGPATFGAHTLTSVGTTDGFIARYAPAGGVWWARRVGSGQLEAVTGIAVTPAGTITATGWYTGTLTVGTAAFPYFPSAGGIDGWAWQLGGGGTHLRAMRYGGAGTDAGLAIDTDPAGTRLLLTGAFTGSITLGAGAGQKTATGIGGTDGFAAQLTANLTPTWVRVVGGPGDDATFGGAIGADGRSVLAVAFHGTAGVVGSPLTHTAWGAPSGTLVAPLTVDGTPRWLQRIDGPGEDVPTSAAITPDGDPIVAVRYDKSTTVGYGSQQDPLLPSGPGSWDGRTVWFGW